MLFIFVWLCSSLLLGIFMFVSNLIHCFHVCVVSFSTAITSWGKERAGNLAYRSLKFCPSVTLIPSKPKNHNVIMKFIPLLSFPN